ncbi:hypothetical protein AB0G97_09060 [Streptomyces sp. NPDC020755]|uniref:hypothetical protein n=1 Tax=Streptomyces sp. NPDC020755 TaxID=3154790 RepID=UPI0033D285F1
MAALTSEDAAALARAEAAREEWPDGTYGHRRPARPPGQPDPEAADHVQELLDGIDGWRVGDRSELAARAEQLP